MMAEERLTAGTDGTMFCAWCVEHWPLYAATGGACELLALHPIALRNGGLVEVGATMPRTLCNPFGAVHGGAISMLLDEVGGIATCCHVGLRYFRGTRHFEVTFLKRVTPGEIVARAWVKGRDDVSVAVESELVQAGQPVARAAATYAVHVPGSIRVPADG